MFGDFVKSLNIKFWQEIKAYIIWFSPPQIIGKFNMRIALYFLS